MTTPSQRAAALIEPLRVDAAETDREGGGESLGEAAQAPEVLETLVQLGRGHLVVGRPYEGQDPAARLWH